VRIPVIGAGIDPDDIAASPRFAPLIDTTLQTLQAYLDRHA
jgi:hypothetical protein